MIKLDSTMMDRLRASSSHKTASSQQQQNKSTTSAELQAVSFQYSKNDVKSFTLFHRTVQRHVDQALPSKFQELQNDLAEQALAEREERAELAANNILGFIGHRLKQDVADGATNEQLESRLNAALEGFNKGYGEANEILTDLNLLSPGVEQDISLTKEKVLAGLDALRQKYLGTSPEFEAATSNYVSGQGPAPSADSTDSLTRQEIGTKLASYSEMQLAQARDFSFELQTRDGDLVTVDASSLFALQAESGKGVTSGEHGRHQFDYQSVSGVRESSFAFSVEGELDVGELEAINELLNKVNDLASDFYHGDVAVAFEKALELGFDDREISGFAFSMSQMQSVKALQAYQPEQAILKPNIMAELKPIGRFASELSRSLTVADEAFAHPRELLSSLMKQMEVIHQPPDFPLEHMGFNEFAVGLIDRFKAPAITE